MFRFVNCNKDRALCLFKNLSQPLMEFSLLALNDHKNYTTSFAAHAKLNKLWKLLFKDFVL